MLNGDDSLTLQHHVQAFLDGGFHLRVECAGRIVQQEIPLTLQLYTSDGNPLALDAGELDAPLSHQGFVSAPAIGVAQLTNKAIGLSTGRSSKNFFFWRVGATIGNVVPYRPMQE